MEDIQIFENFNETQKANGEIRKNFVSIYEIFKFLTTSFTEMVSLVRVGL